MAAAYTLEITHPETTTIQVLESLTLKEARIHQELAERGGYRVRVLPQAQRIQGWVHPLMR